MSWSTRDRDHLTRLARDAREGRSVRPRSASSFYEALASCPSLAAPPNPDDQAACLDALSVAGRPPLDLPEHAEPALLSLATHSHSAPTREAAAAALAELWTRHPPSDDSRARDLLEHHDLDPMPRLRLIVAAGHARDLAEAPSLLDQAEPTIDDLTFLQERLLARPELHGSGGALLDALYQRASWLGRRVLLKTPGRGHAVVVPTLARVATNADPTTRRAVVAALARIGNVSAELILVSLLPGADRNTTHDIAATLAELGTRASLPHLHAARDLHPDLATHLDAATARISERHPVDARAGALSQADDAGALSLAGASPGDVSLYRDAEQALSQPPLAPDPDPSQERWHRLVTPPRDVPAGHLLASVGLNRGLNLAAWIVAAGCLQLVSPAYRYHDVSPFVFLLFIGLSLLLALSFTLRRTLTQRRLLRDGISSFAELVDYTTSPGAEGSAAHLYTFEYMDEHARLHTVTFSFYRALTDLAPDQLTPILYTPDGAAALFDSIHHVGIDADGRLRTPLGAAALGAVGPLCFLASLLHLAT
jgi:HEAT repeat protein